MEGLVIGGFRITRKLGAGGMADVYEARHEHMNHFAAVKLLRPEMSTMATMVQRFFQEAQAAASIKHPGIVHVYDVGYTDSGRAYLLMELLHGQTLHDRIKDRKRLSLEATIRIIRQLAGVMSAVHQRGIIHRDLKPDNILLVQDPERDGEERVKVVDFGLAKLLAVAAPIVDPTAHGAVFGTPAYMAPEQCRDSGDVDPRADLYSIGCIFYRCLCGRAPFGTGGLDVLMAQVSRTPVPPRRYAPGIPFAIEELILRLLAKDRDLRPPSCEAFIAQLDLAVDEQTVRDNRTLRHQLGIVPPKLPGLVPPAGGEPPAATPRPQPAPCVDSHVFDPMDDVHARITGPMATTVILSVDPVDAGDEVEQLSEYELESVMVLDVDAAALPVQPRRAPDCVLPPAEAMPPPGVGPGDAAGFPIDAAAGSRDGAGQSSSPSLSRGELALLPARGPWRTGDRRPWLAVAVFGCLGGLVAAGLIVAKTMDAPDAPEWTSEQGAVQVQGPAPWVRLTEGAKQAVASALAMMAVIHERAREIEARTARVAEVREAAQAFLRQGRCRSLSRLARAAKVELPELYAELQGSTAACRRTAAATVTKPVAKQIRTRFTLPPQPRKAPRINRRRRRSRSRRRRPRTPGIAGASGRARPRRGWERPGSTCTCSTGPRWRRARV